MSELAEYEKERNLLEMSPLETTLAVQSMYSATILSEGNGTDVIDNYHKVKQEFIQGKTSIPEVEEAISQRYMQLTPNLMEKQLQSPDVPIEQKKVILDQLIQGSIPTPTPKEAFHDIVVGRGMTGESVEDQAAANERLDSYGDRMEFLEEKRKIFNSLVAGFSGSYVGALAGFGQAIVPFNEPYFLSQMKNNDYWKGYYEDQGFLDKYITIGDLKEGIIGRINSLPPEEAKLAAQEMANVIADMGGSDFNKFILANDLLGEDQYGYWLSMFDNVIGFGEAASMLALTTKASRAAWRSYHAGKVPPESPLDEVAWHAPNDAREITIDILNDKTGETAKAMGVSNDEVVRSSAFPTVTHNAAEGAPPVEAGVMLERHMNNKRMVAESSTWGTNIKDSSKFAEIEAKRKHLIEDYPRLHTNNSHIKWNNAGNEYNMTARFGRKEGKWFGSYEYAEFAAKGLEPEQGKVTIQKFNATDETWETVTKHEGDGRYSAVLELNKRYDVDALDAYGSEALGARIVSKVKQVAPKAVGWLFDRSSSFDPTIVRGAIRGADVTNKVEDELLGQLRTAFKPLTNRKKLGKVVSFLEGMTEDLTKTGSKYQGQTGYSWGDLARHEAGLDKDQIRAILSYQEVQDTVAALQNRRFTRILKERDMKHIKLSDSSLSPYIYGKPLKNIPDDLSAVITDLSKHTVNSQLKPAEIKRLIAEENHTLVKLLRPMGFGKNEWEYLLLDPKLGKVSELPAYTFPRVPGHVTRLYDEFYKVEKIYEGGTRNGKPITNATEFRKDTLFMSGSKKEAEAWIAKTKLADEVETDPAKVVFPEGTQAGQPKRLTEFKDDEAIFDEFGILTEMQDLYSANPRGTHVAGMWNGSDKAKVMDPLTAAFRDIQNVAHAAGVDDFVTVNKQRLAKTYPQLVKDGQFVQSERKFKEIMSSLNASEAEKAEIRNMFDYIKMMENQPTVYKEAYQKGIFNLAEMMEDWRLGNPAISRYVKEKALMHDPLKVTKSLKFMRYIQLRPLRQMLLQSSQLLQYGVFGPKYYATQFAPDLSAMALLGSTGGRAMPYASKLSGMSAADLKTTWDQFKRSGLLESVKTHPHVQHMRASAAASPIAPQKTAFEVTHAPMTFFGKGFEAGETMNLMGAFLTSRAEWLKTNSLADIGSARALNEISARAREISGAMNAGAKMDYQRGLFSAAMQFASAPHKAALQATFNRSLTPKQKMGMFVWNVALFGEHAYSMGRILDPIFADQRRQDAQEEGNYWSFRRGMVNASFNLLMSEITGQASHVDIAKSTGSTEGYYDLAFQFLEGLNEGDGILSSMAGVGGFYQNEYFTQQMDSVRRMLDMGELRTIEDWKGFAQSVATFAGGWSDWEKFTFAKTHGALLSSSGNEVINDPSHSEIFATLFGLPTERETFIRKNQDREWDERKEIKDMAKRVVREHNRNWRLLGKNGPEGEFESRMQLINRNYSWVPKHLRKPFLDEVLKQSRRSAAAGEDTLVRNMLEDLFNPDLTIEQMEETLMLMSHENQKNFRPMLEDVKAYRDRLKLRESN